MPEMALHSREQAQQHRSGLGGGEQAVAPGSLDKWVRARGLKPATAAETLERPTSGASGAGSLALAECLLVACYCS